MNPIKLSLGDQVTVAFEALAAAEEVSISELLRRAAAQYLETRMGPGWPFQVPSKTLPVSGLAAECSGAEGPGRVPQGSSMALFETERTDGDQVVDALGGTLKEEGEDSLTSPLPPTSPTSLDPTTNPTGESEGGSGGFVYPAEFLEFWAAYPKKHSKGDAFRAWKALGAKRPPLSAILAAIARQRTTEQWKRDGGQYIPYPATWLRGHRWDDDGTTPTTPAQPLRRETNVAVLRQRAERELFGKVPDAQLATAQEELDAAGTADEINRVLTKWLIESRRKGPEPTISTKPGG